MAISTSQGPSLEVSIRKKLKGFELNMSFRPGEAAWESLDPPAAEKA